VIGHPRKRILGHVDRALALNRIILAGWIAAEAQYIPAVFGHPVHQIDVMRMPRLDHIGCRAAPFVPDGRMQLDPVVELRHLICHEAD